MSCEVCLYVRRALQAQRVTAHTEGSFHGKRHNAETIIALSREQPSTVARLCSEAQTLIPQWPCVCLYHTHVYPKPDCDGVIELDICSQLCLCTEVRSRRCAKSLIVSSSIIHSCCTRNMQSSTLLISPTLQAGVQEANKFSPYLSLRPSNYLPYRSPRPEYEKHLFTYPDLFVSPTPVYFL